MNWTTKDIPPQNGKLAVITGATGGLGYETALALAGAGANVVLTGRNAEKGKTALQKIRAAYPNATISYEHCDLNNLASVKAFVDGFKQQHNSLDLLINNAVVMAAPDRYTTADGFELQFGTNYLSHFALTAQLLPLLKKGNKPRVVNLSSVAHRWGKIQLDDLQWERNYKDWPVYGQSKLAMLMFAIELQRRSDAYGWGLMSNAAHPGYAVTELQSTGPRMGRNGKATIAEQIGTLLEPLVAQSAAGGALPTLFGATSPDARGGAYYGPSGLFEMKGPPKEAFVAAKAKDTGVAKALWEASEKLTGVSWAGA